MSSRVLNGMIAAVCLSGATALSAQTPAQPPTQPPSPMASAQPTGSPIVTVIGCVQKENSVLKGNAAGAEMGMGDEFVLTNSKLSPGPPSTAEPPSPTDPKPADTVGTSGSASNFGKVYRVTGDKETDLKSLVGQRVQISGAFKSEADAKTELSTVGTSGRATAELTKENTPEITISSVKPSTGSCTGGGDK